MKTAISVPDDTFDRVDRLAQRLGMSRSEFFSNAASRWADELESSEVTAAIDRALDAAADEDSAFVEAAARRTLERSDG